MAKVVLPIGRIVADGECLGRYLRFWKGSTTKANELELIRLCSHFGLYLPEFNDWLLEFEQCPAREELVDAFGRLRRNTFGTPPPYDEEKLSFMANYIALRWNALVNRAATQAGRKIEAARRKPKKPAVSEWIRRQLKRGTGETVKELYARAPSYVTEPVGKHRFAKRVANERKKMALREVVWVLSLIFTVPAACRSAP
ncbi:MAG: hypothetical protein Q8L45_10630 [Xanthomonadaceae bacterium]|nr:hypothetical protein [Xanthomonadaceae bacterium]MDP2186924.1 hypothetical protein [Xanthomonadales bacterium]MDZ4117370.1 hypothetical protein [Xanthomonadaceae bacterium]MDZ4377814.1 hypothetical protein [Xanthomonadaceae bacterium]